MATVVEKLGRVFSSNQANVLAEVIEAEYDKLVRAGDFNELKEIVRDLADAQDRTKMRVEELGAAQQRTEMRVEELAVAQQRTEMRVEELAAAQQRTEMRVEELTVAQQRTEMRVEELAVAQQRTEMRVEELAVAQKATEKSLTNLARQVGGLSEAFGGSLEDFELDIVPEVLENNWKMKISECGREEISVDGREIEFDLVIRGTIDGHSILVLGEVKSNLTKKEVENFLRLTRRVKDGTAEVRPLFFGYRAQRDARDLIKAEGASMIFTHGKFIA